jgi:hypothetical protein
MDLIANWRSARTKAKPSLRDSKLKLHLLDCAQGHERLWMMQEQCNRRSYVREKSEGERKRFV